MQSLQSIIYYLFRFEASVYQINIEQWPLELIKYLFIKKILSIESL